MRRVTSILLESLCMRWLQEEYLLTEIRPSCHCDQASSGRNGSAQHLCAGSSVQLGADHFEMYPEECGPQIQQDGGCDRRPEAFLIDPQG